MIAHSEALDQLAAALAKAQASVKGASKDMTNPFFKSKYADLSSVWDACRGPLTENGLSLVQVPGFDAATQTVTVATMLLHSSGQWVRGDAAAPFASEKGRSDAQSVGSIVTYLRRYAVAAFASVCPEDDDGNTAGRREVQRAAPKADADGVALISKARRNVPVVPFGKEPPEGNKGVPLSELNDADLHKLRSWCENKDAKKWAGLIASCIEQQEANRIAAQ